MHAHNIENLRHAHVFDQDSPRRGETAVRWVTAVTVAMMLIEITAGLAFGSMALLADGIHMGSHAVALGIAALTYAVARRLAADERFAFGIGKLNALGAFASAVLLLVFALGIAVESVGRVLDPVPIVFNQAILVAVLGLLVNGACAWVLHGGHGPPGGERDAGHHPGNDSDHHDHHDHHHHHHDHTLNAAYLHVAADALTSALAVVALLSAKYLDALWVDPVVAIAGVFLIGRWCWDLLSRTGRVLLDRQAPHGVRRQVIAAIEADGDSRVADLHLWSIGPGIHAAAITVIAHRPETADGYRALLPAAARVVHATIEVHTCPDHPPVGGAESGRIEAAVPSRSRAHGRSAIGGG